MVIYGIFMEYLFFFIILLSDLKYRKIYNHQILALLLSLLAGGSWGGELGFYYSMIVFFIGTLPLVLRFVGGGDIKLISCLSLTINSDYIKKKSI